MLTEEEIVVVIGGGGGLRQKCFSSSARYDLRS